MTIALLAEPASTHALPALSARAKSTPSTPMYAFPAAVAQMFAPAVLSPRDKQSVKATRTINLSANLPPYHRGQVVFYARVRKEISRFVSRICILHLLAERIFLKYIAVPQSFGEIPREKLHAIRKGVTNPLLCLLPIFCKMMRHLVNMHCGIARILSQFPKIPRHFSASSRHFS